MIYGKLCRPYFLKCLYACSERDMLKMLTENVFSIVCLIIIIILHSNKSDDKTCKDGGTTKKGAVENNW